MAYNKETGMYEGYIYKIYNNVNNKIYIGQTTSSIQKRWTGHKTSARNKNKDTHLCRAMRKYGIDKFHIVEINSYYAESKDDLVKELNYYEKYYIKKYKTLSSENGYNMDKGGTTNNYFHVPVKQYDLMLNYIQTFKSITEASENTGIDNAAISSCCVHRQQTGGAFVWCYEYDEPKKPEYTNVDYNLDKVDVTNYYNDDLLKLMMYGWNGKKIIQYNTFGEIINTFKDPYDAANCLKVYIGDITECLVGRRLYFNKTILKYEDEPFSVDDLSKEIRPISMYDMNGNFKMRFISKTEADKFLGVVDGSVSKAMVRGGSCKGHLFSYYGEPIIRKIRSREIPIEMLDDNGNIIKTFDFMGLIAEYFNIGDCYKQIRKAIKEKKKYREHYWRYKEEFAIA